ncbi:MAG: PAS domain S-box protein [Bacteroidota bacterium]
MSDLKNQEFETFDFFERTPVLVCIAGKEGFFRKVNPAVIDKLGYTERELFDSPISSFIHPEDKEFTRQEREKLLGGQPLVNFQNRYITKSGSIIWLEWTSIYFPEKEIVFALANDITDKKRAEKEIEEKFIKFKSLANHFKSSIEEERKYLAAELHEELAQLASVVKMDIDFVNLVTPDLAVNSKARLEHAVAISGLLISTIRRMSFSLSPQMLYDHGLNATLEWYCREFAMLNNIPCDFTSNYSDGSLTSEFELDFFRVCQEALNNVTSHANAGNVKITLVDRGNKIFMAIIDDGRGFNTNQQRQTGGLKSIEEQVASINGELFIESKPGKGTEIRVTVSKQ